ncbi:carboxypeptidase-like regulatory domain-containing protein [Algoriphagus vanfongensis]|uniref:carboxypeptidase-like regulatory domain-containing protein n=1 Tax=Algoriphagus vanfongensis TaxID=426371 RepID=UPI00047D8F5D|nr:carboxypeptidase-like regulatory domain-containing protein [Algoriphagus vanfongensis]
MKKILLLFLFLTSSGCLMAQSTYSGNVLDGSDKAYMEGVQVSVAGQKASAVTNQRGYFSVDATPGDTLKLSFPGFIEQEIVLGTERFLMVQLQDMARFLPTFEVKSQAYSYRLKDGRLVLKDENEAELPSRKGEVTAGTRSDDPNGGVAISGAISYFTKKAKQAREYEKKKAWHARRQGYYEVIQSDSVQADLMAKYELEQSDWDALVIRFNQFHQSHEFLDWSEEKVQKSLEEFFRFETAFSN